MTTAIWKQSLFSQVRLGIWGRNYTLNRFVLGTVLCVHRSAS